MHLTVGIFGKREDANALASKLGKKGTTNDIAIYNHSSSEGVLTYVCPNSESGKIQPVLECMSMADMPAVVVSSLDKEMGEVIVALSEFEFPVVFFVADQAMEEQLKPLIQSAGISAKFVRDEKELRTGIISFGSGIKRPDSESDRLVIPVDNCFKVKGVGTIVLGVVKSGIVKKHQEVLVEPAGLPATIKGIQSQDNDIDQACAGMRVGLNLKGLEPEDIKRGFVVCSKDNPVRKSSELELDFEQNKFFKQELKEKVRVMASAGLQIVSCEVKSASGKLSLLASQPIVCEPGQNIVVASQTDILPRIAGSGRVCY